MAFALLAAVGAVINTHRTLRGVVLHADVSGWTLRVDQTENGLRGQIDFSVAVSAFTLK